jgi:hypothetical protein
MLIARQSKSADSWAHIVENIRYKDCDILIKENECLLLKKLKQNESVAVYFSDPKQLRPFFEVIGERKTNILLKELTLFSEDLQKLKSVVESQL